jgi:hypothetical protein
MGQSVIIGDAERMTKLHPCTRCTWCDDETNHNLWNPITLTVSGIGVAGSDSIPRSNSRAKKTPRILALEKRILLR